MSDSVPVMVHIKRVSDGLERIYPFPEYGWWDGKEDCADFIWSEGNYSCDCNRSLFFARAANEDEPEETECGMSQYLIRILDMSGKEVYRDESWV